MAASKEGRIKALLLEEARLLEFYAELRAWLALTDLGRPDRQSMARSKTDGQDGWSTPYDFAPFLNKLSSRMALPISDQRALLAASTPRQVLKGECLIEQGADLSSLLILCSGMAHAVRILADGSQQIVAVFVAGDALNAGELVFRQSRTAIFSLTATICLSIPLRQLNELVASQPAIARALWLETAMQAAIQQEWMVWLGRRTAQTRLAHFLCEVSHRLQLSAHSIHDAFEFPLTQRELADTLGLSPVHVNRVLQAMRRQGLIELSRNRLAIRDKAALSKIAEFDPQYLDGMKLSGQEAM
jgi:CRP-like cAMP-binding protein